jgi:hypothetical protein
VEWIRYEKSRVDYVIGSMPLSTDGTNSLLMNSPVWTRILELELDFGMDSSTTCAMVIRGEIFAESTLGRSIKQPGLL